MNLGDSNAAVRSDTRRRAEAILARKGISRAAALELYYQQIIAHDGLPFSVVPRPLARDEMTKEEFDEMMETGLRQAKAGLSRDVEEVFRELESRL